MNISEIAKQLNAKKSGVGWMACCPAHKDDHPSLWFSDTQTPKNPLGKLRFQCKKGCDYREIRSALGIIGGAELTPEQRAKRINAEPVVEDTLGLMVRKRKIKRLWDKSIPIVEGSPVWNYLRNIRKVLKPSTQIPAVMREIPDLGYYESQNDDFVCVGRFPAIITRLDDINGNMVTIHRTYLALDGSGKAPVEKAKKLMQSPVDGCTDGAAIKLFRPVSFVESISDLESKRVILGLSEGIESALAAYTLTGIPTWAAWSASGLVKVDLPPEVTDLILFGDNDPAGRKAINDLLERLKEESPTIRVVIKLPQTPGADWADEILK